ncbi:MAG TPA: hypothetical protein VGF40_14520 [Thermoanaerobaculia bacterium]
MKENPPMDEREETRSAPERFEAERDLRLPLDVPPDEEVPFHVPRD